MIPAVEALRLSIAKLTDEEIAAADALEKKIEARVHESMRYSGVDFSAEETNLNVVAEVSQRLKAAGYNPEWRYRIEKNRFNAALTKLVGFDLTLGPSDESYRSARTQP